MTLVAFPETRTRRVPAKAPATRQKLPPKPFTLPHFRAWAADLILDTGQSWHPEDFQEAFIGDVFAGYPECWFVVPEGNTKTTTMAGLGLYHCEYRPFAFVPVGAASRDQAQTLYQQAEGFVLRSPRLHEPVHSPIQEAKGKRKLQVPRFNPLPGYRRIDHHEGGRMQIYAADDATGDGVIPTLALLDELHRHRTLHLYRTWAGKLQKRGGQLGAISTSGEPGSEFELTRERIRQQAETVTRKGSFVRAASKGLVLHEWAVPEGGNVEDMAVVKAANPFSRITVQSLTDKFASPTMTMEHWRRFVCNVPTRGNNAAIQEVEWAKAATTDRIPDGQPVWLGLDIGWKWDTTAAVPLWFRDEQYRLLGPAEILVPPRDGTSLDPEKVKAALLGIHARNPVHTVVMDLSKAGFDFAAWIETELGATVIEHSETNASLTQDYDAFMEALRNGWLRHSGDPGLTSHVLNAIARLTQAGEARFDRPSTVRISAEQNQRVIDALAAAAMVHGQAAKREPEVEWTVL